MVRQDPYLWWIGGVILSGTHGFPLWCPGNDYGDGPRNGFGGEIPAWDGFSILFSKGISLLWTVGVWTPSDVPGLIGDRFFR